LKPYWGNPTVRNFRGGAGNGTTVMDCSRRVRRGTRKLLCYRASALLDPCSPLSSLPNPPSSPPKYLYPLPLVGSRRTVPKAQNKNAECRGAPGEADHNDRGRGRGEGETGVKREGVEGGLEGGGREGGGNAAPIKPPSQAQKVRAAEPLNQQSAYARGRACFFLCNGIY